jgi:uncharacterized damage-inducible protein DinB
MSKKENLKYSLATNQRGVRALIDDISETESLERGKDNLQHIRWLTGHLVTNAYQILKTLGGEADYPEQWLTLFKRGCGWHDDPSVYPPMAELKTRLYALYAQINQRLEEMPEEDLDRELWKEAGFQTSAMNTATFFCKHEFYHMGQIAAIRRILGRERSFG